GRWERARASLRGLCTRGSLGRWRRRGGLGGRRGDGGGHDALGGRQRRELDALLRWRVHEGDRGRGVTLGTGDQRVRPTIAGQLALEAPAADRDALGRALGARWLDGRGHPERGGRWARRRWSGLLGGHRGARRAGVVARASEDDDGYADERERADEERAEREQAEERQPR